MTKPAKQLEVWSGSATLCRAASNRFQKINDKKQLASGILCYVVMELKKFIRFVWIGDIVMV